jgi:hypothetical protein
MSSADRAIVSIGASACDVVATTTAIPSASAVVIGVATNIDRAIAMR